MRFLLPSFFWIYGLFAAAQPPAAVRVTLYNETNGINKGRVTCMLQGSNGYLWLGSTNGLLRFDGYGFKQFTDTAMSNTATNLAEDSSGNLWMSLLGGGLLRYEPFSGRFTRYTVSVASDSSVATAETEMIYFDRHNQLWLGLTQKGLIKADPARGRYERFNLIDPRTSVYPAALQNVYNTVYAAAEEAGENLWLATHDGLYRFNRKTNSLTAVRDASLQKGTPRYDLFGSLYLERDTLWLTAWDGGLSRYAIRSGGWKTWLPSQQQKGPLQSNIVLSIKPKGPAGFWFTAADRGLGTFDRQSERFSFLSNNAAYPTVPGGTWARSLLDKQQNLWALQDENLVKVEAPGQKFVFHPFTIAKKPVVVYVSDRWENESLAVTATLGANGLYVLNKKTGRRFAPVLPYVTNGGGTEVRQLYEDSGKNLWVVTPEGIYNYDFNANRLIKAPQPVAEGISSFSQIGQDKQGRLWITTRRNGLFVYERGNGRYTHYCKDSLGLHFLPAYNVSSVAVDAKGRIWICSPYGLLAWIDPQSGALQRVGNDEMTGTTLRGTQCYSLFSDAEGNIWAGTYYGLCFFDARGEKPILKKMLKASDGLRANLVVTMEEDKAGNVWCLTDAALCRVRKGDFTVSSFDGSDGVSWRGPMPRLKRQAGSDSLALFADNGWYSFNPGSFHEKGAAAPLVISSMTVNDQPYFFEEALKQAGRVELSPSQHVFSFEFAVLDFSKPANYTYAYRLEGYDKDWIQSGSRRFASYTNLPGGAYNFLVRTNNGQQLRLPLFIQTPFIKKPLFFLLLAVVTGLLVYLFFRSRIAHHREVFQLHAKTQTLQKEKATVMYDALKQQLNPHFLFNSLSSLSSLIEKDGKLANHFLEQLSNVYRYILKNRDKDLVPLGEELKFVSSYIELQKTRFKEGLKVSMTVDDHYCLGRVAPVVLQNLVENAIKHNSTSKESPLAICIRCEDDYLIVRNKLQKKAVVETSNGQGLANLRTLYSYYTDSPVTVEETADTFTIKIPLL